MTGTAGGLLLALASAAALNWGFYAQHGAASALPPLALRRPLASLRVLLRSRRWLVGFATGIGGWALYVAALARAPLSLVQAASAGGIGLLALLASRGGAALTLRERVAVGASVAGLALLGGSLAGHSGGGQRGTTAALALWIGTSAAAAALLSGRGGEALAPGAGLGAAAGLLYAAGDVATKAAVGSGARLALVPVVLALHGLAFVALQLGFQRGGALATAGVATLATNALPIAGGMVVFREPLPHGILGALRAAAFALTVLGAALIARPELPLERAAPAAVR